MKTTADSDAARRCIRGDRVDGRNGPRLPAGQHRRVQKKGERLAPFAHSYRPVPRPL